MPTECCVPLCKNKGGHKFPLALTDAQRRKAWVVAVRRGEARWEPGKYSVVCQAHFTDEDYTAVTYDGTRPLYRMLKPSAVPHVFEWTQPPLPSVLQREERAKARQSKRNLFNTQKQDDDEDLGAWPMENMDIEMEETTIGTGVSSPPEEMVRERQSCEAATQTSETSTKPPFPADLFVNDPEAIQFYTGLKDYETFRCVLSSLGAAANCLNYYSGAVPPLEVEDQFFLTLIKLRQHKTNFELSKLFGITITGVTNVFVTWVNFLFHQWGEVNWWPSREDVDFCAPTDFKSKYPSTRVIVDGTECAVQKPKQPVAQQATFSTYKNRNTVKILVGCSPGGLVSYISEAYGGSASDRQICERGNLAHMCDPGDSIMADKGFNVQDLFIPYDVQINIPAFFKKTNRISSHTVMKDRKLASKRVHVERIIGLGKTYKILVRPMNNTESALATQIISVCFWLCNFRDCIVPKYA